MADDRRNPYVILGISFGATESEARTGFAKANRRLRQDQDDEARYTMEDLTWALHQVEQIIEDPDKALNVYRVPADPEATSIERPGIFNPQPQQIKRSTEPATNEEREVLKSRAIQEVTRGALTSDVVKFTIPGPYELKERTNGQ